MASGVGLRGGAELGTARGDGGGLRTGAGVTLGKSGRALGTR